MPRYDLVSAFEIRNRLDVNRQRVYQLTQRPDFPAPIATLGIGHIWLRSEVEAWIAEHRPPADVSASPAPRASRRRI
jgi:prophage regulatory protein